MPTINNVIKIKDSLIANSVVIHEVPILINITNSSLNLENDLNIVKIGINTLLIKTNNLLVNKGFDINVSSGKIYAQITIPYWGDYNCEREYLIFSSQPYPKFFTEHMDVRASLISGILNVVFRYQYHTIPTESLSLTPSLVSGNLRTLVIPYSYQENLAVTPTLISGTLRTIVINTSTLDNLGIYPQLLTGSLGTKVIGVISEPDKLSVTPSLVSGSLVTL